MDVGTDDRRVDARVQRFDRVTVRLVERADDDPVGLQEVPHRRSLCGELRIRHVSDRRETARVERRAHLLARADRHRGLHHDRRAGVLRKLVDDGPDTREIGIARVERRRVDADEEELRAVERLAHVERVAEAVAVLREQLFEPGLVDRHRAAAERVDLLRHDVADDDLVTQIREAGTGDEADVAASEDCDSRHGRLAYRSGLRPFAISIIVSFESRSSSVFTTQ